jgi:ABC-type amino acid transport substrate-binding protein
MPRLSLLVLVLLASVGVACVAADGAEERTEGARPIVVGSDLDNPPFAYLDADGRPAGRDVQMMRWIAGMLGRELEWRRMPFERLLDACAVGEVDVVCATLGITAERMRRVDFSRPYFETVIAVVAREGPGEPRTIADLAGRRVAAGPGTTSEKAVRERSWFAHGVFDGEKSSTARLVSGEVDAVAMDEPAARRTVAASRGPGAGPRLVLLEGDLGAERYALALPRGSALGPPIDRALRVLEERGDLALLDRSHGL